MSGRAASVRRRGMAVLGAALLLLPSCSPEAPRLRPLAPDAVILAFGDSLTRGTGAEPDQSYPAELGRLVGRRVVNAGVPGEVTGEGARRLPGVLAGVRPDLVLLCHGGNDMLRRLPNERTQANLRAMLRAVRAAGADAVLVGVPEPTFRARPPGFYEELARELEVPYVKGALADILRDPSLKADPIHPNAEGYRRLALAVQRALAQAGAVP